MKRRGIKFRIEAIGIALATLIAIGFAWQQIEIAQLREETAAIAMGQFGNKLRRYGTSGTPRGFAHWCPACGEAHVYVTERDTHAPPMWRFNGSAEAPSFSPSMKITGKQTIKDAQGEWTGEWVRDAAGKAVDMCCHYFVTDGQIAYCSDSTHEMRGQTVPLPDLPPHLCD